MTKFFRHSFVSILLLVGMCVSAPAQSTTDGAIGGTVKDPNGALVTGAAVTVRNEETNKESSATTDDEGRFRVSQLQPGNYTVSINATNFAPFNQGKIVVEVGRVTSLDIPLSITGASEVVEVTGEAPVINTTQQDFSTNINQTSINELPINGRRWSNFALLTPGAVPDGTFGLISFRGISGLLNNNTIDGGDNNQAFFAEERGRTRISYSISQAAIREFQVNTSSYSAEYGRCGGRRRQRRHQERHQRVPRPGLLLPAQQQVGRAQPAGDEHRPRQQRAHPGRHQAEDVRHQFGGVVGGPIAKDKLFFFFSYDQQKRNFPGLARFSSTTFLNLTAANRNTLLGARPDRRADRRHRLASSTA